MGQPTSVPVRITERQQTTSNSLRGWKTTLFGVCAIRLNTSLAVATTAVMSDIVFRRRRSTVRSPLEFFLYLTKPTIYKISILMVGN